MTDPKQVLLDSLKRQKVVEEAMKKLAKTIADEKEKKRTSASTG